MTRRTRKNSKKLYKQRGGAFTQEQRNTLINNVNFTEDEVNELDEYQVSFENIQSANHLYLDDPHRTMIIVSKYLHDVQNQQQNENDNHGDDLNIEDLQGEGEGQGEGQGEVEGQGPDVLDQGFNNDLDISDDTDPEQGSFSFDEDDDQNGGKRRKTIKTRKTRKTRKSRKGKSRKMRGRKQRGGARYGTGVGANNFDPNYSIYNTQELNLFPYKPN
jgi:hypothetical protein